MNRLQKKCIIASAGLHLSLALVLFVGPAFLSHQSKDNDMPVLVVIPSKTVDALVSSTGGGAPPAARTPEPPAPPAPHVEPPPPEPRHGPEPPTPNPPEVRNSDQNDSLVLSDTHKHKKPEVSTKIVTRSSTEHTNDNSARDQEQARETVRTHRLLAEALGHAASNIGTGVSSRTSIDFGTGSGSGPAYANFYQVVKSVYFNAWVLPDGLTDDEATTSATVTIARDGTVVSWQLTHSSGSPAVDQSVRVVLERVKFVAPLPDTAKENERTVPIKFYAKAKKGI